MATHLDETSAHDVAMRALDQMGGPRMIYRNPRHPFSLDASRMIVVDQHEVVIRWGEVSSPAIVTVAGWVFEIHDTGIELLVRPAGQT